ncbi:MAG TPA: type II toxin-antitoxin system RelE/ParE family toxin [Thermoanaerobaculia bacterium]|nr:type II toxin-antitoxin system RelE/ParE family toxin [Thermoanaerobaculia bacterium]
MPYRVEWAESAIADLIAAVDYIARDSPSYAASLAVQADQAALSLADFPNRGRRVREYPKPASRELILGGSYRLIYQVSGTTVSVIAILHSSRNLPGANEDDGP